MTILTIDPDRLLSLIPDEVLAKDEALQLFIEVLKLEEQIDVTEMLAKHLTLDSKQIIQGKELAVQLERLREQIKRGLHQASKMDFSDLEP